MVKTLQKIGIGIGVVIFLIGFWFLINFLFWIILIALGIPVCIGCYFGLESFLLALDPTSSSYERGQKEYVQANPILELFKEEEKEK